VFIGVIVVNILVGSPTPEPQAEWPASSRETIKTLNPICFALM
jgi:hypothetical protein